MLDQIAYSDALILVARIFLMALFVSTGWEKLTNFAATVGYMQTVKAPLPAIAAAIAVFMEFFVGIAIIVGILTRLLALAFAVFTLGTALLGHRFWTMDGTRIGMPGFAGFPSHHFRSCLNGAEADVTVGPSRSPLRTRSGYDHRSST